MSSHTIQTLLSLASETTQPATREDCENCLNAIRRTGGNHKLKLDADLNMFLPDVVRRGIGEAVKSQGAEMERFHKTPFQVEKRNKKEDSLPLVEPLAYHDLFHGATVASL